MNNLKMLKFLLEFRIEIIFLVGCRVMCNNLMNGVTNQMRKYTTAPNVQPQLRAVQIPQQNVLSL